MWLPEKNLTIHQGASIFAMGSCFAREIEEAFAQRNFPILSRPPFDLLPSGRAEYGTLNRYNTASMLLEFRRLLEDQSVVPDDALLIRESAEVFSDAHYHNASTGTLAEVLDRRRRFHAIFQNVKAADLIVLTLGLNEAGYEIDSGLYRNVSPTFKEMRRGAKLEVHTLTVQENVANLEAIRGLVRKHCYKSPPIVVTVSPVPLSLTYLTDDVVVANGASKATLRAAACEFCSLHTDVHYFPSYEIAMNSDPACVFEPDKRHIRLQFVRHIIGQFIARYVPRQKSRAAARLIKRRNRPVDALAAR